MKYILKQRILVAEKDMWNIVLSKDHVKMKNIYHELLQGHNIVMWRKMLFDNMARSRAIFMMWLACHGKLVTKEILKRFGVMHSDNCNFCDKQ